MYGVVVEEIDEVIGVHEWIVDGHDLSQVSLLLGCSEDESSDSTESVDSNSYVRHIYDIFRICESCN